MWWWMLAAGGGLMAGGDWASLTASSAGSPFTVLTMLWGCAMSVWVVPDGGRSSWKGGGDRGRMERSGLLGAG